MAVKKARILSANQERNLALGGTIRARKALEGILNGRRDVLRTSERSCLLEAINALRMFEEKWRKS